MARPPIPGWLDDYSSRGLRASDVAGVVLVANVKGRTIVTDDFDHHSLTTEFLSDIEMDELVAWFESSGFYCEALLDEEGFLGWLRNGRGTFPRELPLIYNLSQNGHGPARLATVASLARMFGLPLLDSESHAAALAQHKFHTACVLKANGIPAAATWWLTTRGWIPDAPPAGLRVIAKPTYESASIGIDRDSIQIMHDELTAALLVKVQSFRQPFTVQEFIPGYEVEVPLLETDRVRALGTVGIRDTESVVLGDRVLLYEDVFNDNYGFYDFAQVQPDTALRLKRLAESVFAQMGLSGMARVDFRVTPEGVPAVMEVNAKPHMTAHSSFAFVSGMVGASRVHLARALVGAAVERHEVARQSTAQNWMSVNRNPRA